MLKTEQNIHQNLPDDVAILRQLLLKKEAADQELDTQYQTLQQQYESLRHQLNLLLHHQFGKRSERFVEGEEILEAIPGQPEATEEINYICRKKKGHGRKAIPDNLAREKIICDIAEDQKQCPCGCGKPLRKIDEVVTEQLEIVPQKIYVKQFIQIKYTGCAESDQIITSPKPAQPIEKGLAGPGLLADILVKKYDDHLPLYRQSEILARHDINIARSTLSDWVAQSTQLLKSIVEAMKKPLLQSPKIHTDDTTVSILDKNHPGKTKTGRLWVYCGCGGSSPPLVIYDYSPDRKEVHPQRFLQDYEGYLQADAYTGYDILYQDDAIIEVACMAHARRKFMDINKVSKSPGLATEALRYIQKLYKIEKAIKELTEVGKKIKRQRESKPILKKFQHWLETNQPRVLPKSPLGKAIKYTLNQWEALNRYCKNGWLEIDNNQAERLMRPIAIGRKNWLFAGSDLGGENAAII